MSSSSLSLGKPEGSMWWCTSQQFVKKGGIQGNPQSCISCSMQEHSLLKKAVRKLAPFIPFSESLFLCVSLMIFVVVKSFDIKVFFKQVGQLIMVYYCFQGFCATLKVVACYLRFVRVFSVLMSLATYCCNLVEFLDFIMVDPKS